MSAGPVQAMGLAEAYDRALSSDPGVAAAERDLASAREVLQQAKGARLPSVTADARYVQSRYERNVVERDPRTLETSTSLEEQSQNSYSWGVSVSQPLFDAEVGQRVDRADKNVAVAEMRLAKQKHEVALRVAEAYFQVLLAKRNLELAQVEREAYRARWKQMREWLNRGLAKRADMLEAKVRYDRGVSAVITAENRLNVARMRLQRFVGGPFDGVEVLDLSGELDGRVSPDRVSQWVEIARQENPDVRLAMMQADVAREDVDIQSSRRLPKLNLVARYSDTNSLDEVIGGEDKRIYVELTAPLYQGGQLKAGVRQARETRDSYLQQLLGARRSAELLVREKAMSFFSASRRARSLQGSLESADAFLDAAEESHRLGLKELVEVLDARSQVFEIRRDLAEAEHEQMLSWLELKSAMNRLDEGFLADLEDSAPVTE